jgi:hypothetical protein
VQKNLGVSTTDFSQSWMSDPLRTWLLLMDNPR